jgi:peptidoglycan/xylan/chitin deacetylase (PgdA/CDA1 family)
MRRPPCLLLLVPLLACSAGWASAQGPAPRPGSAAAPDPVDRGVVVLMYHRFGDDRFPSTNIRMEQFRAHLRELRRSQYHVRPLPEIVAALRAGRALPDRTVGISIDDAYRSIYTQAWPLLREAGLPFTIFVATEGVDRGFEDLLGWAQLREMVASGLVTLGNHTATHPHMADTGPARNRSELEEAARRIEAETGQRPRIFAYPYGEYSTAVRKLVEGMGFDAAFGQHSGAIGAELDLLTLPRFALNEHYGSEERFRLAVNTLPLPVRDVIPVDPLLPPQHDRPLFGFTVAPAVGGLEGLACYVSGQGRLALSRIGERRFEGRPEQPLAAGRTRINCTLPAGGGRWRWFGTQLYRPGS